MNPNSFKNSKLKIRNFSLMMLFAFCFLGVHQADASALPKPPNNLGLVGYWSMNDCSSDKATDFSGNGNTGTLTNFALTGSTSNWTTAGKRGCALDFDGTNDYVTGSNTGFSNLSELTLSAWANVRTTGPNCIITSGTGGNRNLQMCAVNAYFGNTGLAFYSVATGLIYSTNVPSVLGWHFYTVTYSGGNLSFYMDGVLINTQGSVAALGAASTANYQIGNDGFSSYFPGPIDEVRVYNRALGPTEVTALYNTGATKINGANSDKSAGLVGHWKLDDRSGTSAADSAGTNTGTLTNFALSGLTSNWVSARLAGGLHFDGASDRVTIPGITTTTTFTYSAWIKPDSSTDSYGPLFANSGDSIGIYYRGSAAGGNAGKITYWNGADKLSTGTLTDQQWNHVAVVNSGGNITFYINGVASGTNTGGQSFVAVYMGNTPFPLNFKGTMDDVRLYNTPLTAEEIRTLYASGTARPTIINSTSSRIQGSNLASGLVGHWTFDGSKLSTTTATDSSTSANNGTLTNGPVPTLGKLGQALSFDGVNDYVDNGNPSILRLTSAVTVSAWVKPRASNNGLLVHEFGGYGISHGFSTIGGATDRFNFNMFKSGGWTVVNSTTVPSLNTWYHVVGTYDGTNGRMYVNGALEATSGTVTAPLDTGSGSVIGAYSGGQGSNADIDDARIYNRALTDAEVTALYNMGK